MTQGTHVENPAVSLEALTDDQLLRQVESLSRAEHAAMIHVLHHLNEIERRRLHLDLGYRSMFDYCIRSLEYSPAAAGRRIQAARCIRRFPAVLPLLREREINLSVISLIEPILTIDNFKTILEQVRGVPYRDVERLASEYRPPVAFRDRVQPVRVAMPLEKDGFARTKAEQEVLTPDVGSADKKVRIEQKLLVQFLASEDLMKKIEEAQALLSNRCPEGSLAGVFDALVSDFLERHSPAERKKRREGRSEAAVPDTRHRERVLSNNDRSRHIPDEIRDNVFVRDEGKCAYVSLAGTRCGSRRGLQVDHIQPFAAGGSSDLSNLRLLCAAHNRRAAEKALGTQVMAQYWRQQ